MKNITLETKPTINQLITINLDNQNYQAKIIDKNDSYIICEINLRDCVDTFTFKYELLKFKPAYDMVLNIGLKRIYLSKNTEIELIEKLNDKTYFGRFKRLSDDQTFCLLNCQVSY